MSSANVLLFADGPTWYHHLLNVVLLVTSVLLIGLILIQRGKGGGLTGAFGGAGGASAFGSRAGDTFTWITIYTAAAWILLIMILVKFVQPAAGPAVAEPAVTLPAAPPPPPDDAP